MRADGVYSKLADWDDDDPSAMLDTSSRWDKVVILKHMFTLEELEVSGYSLPGIDIRWKMVWYVNGAHYGFLLQKDPAAILDIKEDIRDECAKLGDVTNVVLFDKEPDGVASVRFSNPEAAKACVRVC